MTFGSSLHSAAERRRPQGSGALLIAGALAAGACAGVYSLPSPRTLVNHTGARIHADEARLAEIDIWVREQQENIIVDPSFWIIETSSEVETYPWDALSISGDTAVVLVYASAPESGSFMSFYGHFHLMDTMDRLDEVLPEAVDAEGYELERADSFPHIRRLVIRACGVRYGSLRTARRAFFFPTKTGTWTLLFSPRAPRSSRRDAIRGYRRIQDVRRSIAAGSSRPSRGSRRASGSPRGIEPHLRHEGLVSLGGGRPLVKRPRHLPFGADRASASVQQCHVDIHATGPVKPIV